MGRKRNPWRGKRQGFQGQAGKASTVKGKASATASPTPWWVSTLRWEPLLGMREHPEWAWSNGPSLVCPDRACVVFTCHGVAVANVVSSAASCTHDLSDFTDWTEADPSVVLDVLQSPADPAVAR